MDPTMAATTAIGVALPYLAMLGKKAAESAAGAAGKSAWEWLKGKLTSEAGKEVVKDLESAPDDVDNRKAAEAALSKFLRSDRRALSELAQLLKEVGVTGTVQTADVDGDDNIVAQASGGSSVSVNTGRAPRLRPKGPTP
jgi:hypothetical protein